MFAEKKGSNEYEVWPVGKHHFRHDSEVLELPAGWCTVESGDATLTRRIKTQCEHWVILGKFKNRITSKGLCAPQADVERIRRELEAERTTPEYQKKLEQGRQYRARKQDHYVEEFEREVLEFLRFDEKWHELAKRLAHAVTEHATPVGSGTVARTQRIAIEERAEAAVIAWMRHQTTCYDQMHIPKIAGERRHVRRELAEKSRQILDQYRRGLDVDLSSCPLAKALNYPQNFDEFSKID